MLVVRQEEPSEYLEKKADKLFRRGDIHEAQEYYKKALEQKSIEAFEDKRVKDMCGDLYRG